MTLAVYWIQVNQTKAIKYKFNTSNIKKIELHEVNADLVQARESAVAVKALEDEIENEMAKLKDYNLRYNHGEISRE